MNCLTTEGSIGLSTGQMQSFLDKYEDTNGVSRETSMSERDGVPTT
jgi:hypothetical protein